MGESTASTTSGQLAELTSRETEVLAALMEGKSAHEIAEEQIVELCTVRSHIATLLHKLGLHSQVAAVAWAFRSGMSPDRLRDGRAAPTARS